MTIFFFLLFNNISLRLSFDDFLCLMYTFREFDQPLLGLFTRYFFVDLYSLGCVFARLFTMFPSYYEGCRVIEHKPRQQLQQHFAGLCFVVYGYSLLLFIYNCIKRNGFLKLIPWTRGFLINIKVYI